MKTVLFIKSNYSIELSDISPTINKTGSSQVGAISKAQKYSSTTIENIWKNFFQKNFLNFFSKNIFLESRTMPKNSKRGHSGSLNVFTNRKLQKKCKGLPFDRIRKFSKKSRIVPKKNGKNQTKENLLWSRIYFWKHKKFVV